MLPCLYVCEYCTAHGASNVTITSACLYEQNWSFFTTCPLLLCTKTKWQCCRVCSSAKNLGAQPCPKQRKHVTKSKQPSPIHPIRTTHITMTDIDGYLQIRDNRTKHFLVDTTTTTTTTTTSNLLQFQLRNLLSAYQRLIS